MKKIFFFAIAILLYSTGVYAKEYPKNTITIYPIVFFGNASGVTVSYDRILGKDKKIALSLPITFGLISGSENVYGTYDGEINNTVYMLNPGLKFYPFGANNAVNYSMGMSALIHFGQNNYVNYLSSSSTYAYNEESFYSLGTFVQNQVDFHIAKGFGLGIQAGFGPKFYNHIKNTTQHISYNTTTTFIGQIGFYFNYKF